MMRIEVTITPPPVKPNTFADSLLSTKLTFVFLYLDNVFLSNFKFDVKLLIFRAISSLLCDVRTISSVHSSQSQERPFIASETGIAIPGPTVDGVLLI